MTLRNGMDYNDMREVRAKGPGDSRNIPASAPTTRKNRRALVKALGARQFKKLYRKAQA
jgi:hypothetical protein